ncbi:MAG TPA: lysylphosphatidylglycerol synthase transmembrane domain-containing protein [Moheibacter sp.]|nr:lysylphosphatidylglycerol synthase transmembrane domain-containing protein [Moheibacter sp.]
MKSRIGQLIFTIAAIILAAVFIWLTLKQTDIEVLKSAAKSANYFWFIASMALSIFSYWLRAARWKLLLEGIGYEMKTKSGFWAVSLGYFTNLVIPRSGEIARATSLYKMEKVPADKSIGTIVLERVIDVLFLALFFVLTLIFNAETLFSFFSFTETPSLGKYGILLGIFFLAFLILLAFRKKLKGFSIYQRIELFLKGIWVGFKSILHLKERTKFILYSFGIWLCYFLMTYLVIFAFPETSHFSLGTGFFLIVSGALGMILPAVGGLGYPYIMSLAFAAIYMSQGQTAEEGKIVGNYFGLMLYFAQIISILIFGFLSIFYISRNKMNK